MHRRVRTVPTAPGRVPIEADRLVGQPRQRRRGPGGEGRREGDRINPAPVSYTHLDVYKRQLQPILLQ